MTDQLPAARPRGRHADPNLPVDAPSTAAIALPRLSLVPNAPVASDAPVAPDAPAASDAPVAADAPVAPAPVGVRGEAPHLPGADVEPIAPPVSPWSPEARLLQQPSQPSIVDAQPDASVVAARPDESQLAADDLDHDGIDDLDPRASTDADDRPGLDDRPDLDAVGDELPHFALPPVEEPGSFGLVAPLSAVGDAAEAVPVVPPITSPVAVLERDDAAFAAALLAEKQRQEAPADQARAATTGTTDDQDAAAPTRGRVLAGIALSLLIVPIGVAVWTALWSFGFITAVVAVGISCGAVLLYRLGARTRVTTGAAWALFGVVLLTLALAFIAGIAADLISASDLDPSATLGTSAFQESLRQSLTSPAVWQDSGLYLGVALLFAVLGFAGILIAVRRDQRA